MNKIFYFILSIMILHSCDNIKDNEKSFIVENINVTRPVLLEDYTGQNCINCPEAMSRAVNIQNAMKNHLIIVSIHAGPFSTSRFRTEAGTEYQKKFYPENDVYPAGIIDRNRFSNSYVSTNSIVWGTYILQRAQLSEIPLFNMSLSCEYNEQNNHLTVTSNIQSFSSYSNLKLQLWVTESHIFASQKSESGTIRDYEHNHVLRDAINGIWGEDIELISGIQNKYTSETYSLEGKDWVPANMHIVGFIYDSNTMEILHTTEIPLLNNN